MILIDTSAWIEFQRATGSEADRRVKAAIESDEPVATTGVVTMELLAGARDERQAEELERLLARCTYLAAEEPSDYEMAARLYRVCREGGETVRRLPDCLIAAVALRAEAAVVHCDADFDALARHCTLQLAL